MVWWQYALLLFLETEARSFSVSGCSAPSLHCGFVWLTGLRVANKADIRHQHGYMRPFLPRADNRIHAVDQPILAGGVRSKVDAKRKINIETSNRWSLALDKACMRRKLYATYILLPANSPFIGTHKRTLESRHFSRTSLAVSHAQLKIHWLTKSEYSSFKYCSKDSSLVLLLCSCQLVAIVITPPRCFVLIHPQKLLPEFLRPHLSLWRPY